MTSIVINLVENAIKYSPHNSLIGVELMSDHDHVRFVVKDQGIGVESSDKSKIFTKFYRVGNEDTRKTKGTGLGLFIVQELVDFHEGKIYIEDNVPKGSIFIVEMPRTIAKAYLGSLKEEKMT